MRHLPLWLHSIRNICTSNMTCLLKDIPLKAVQPYADLGNDLYMGPRLGSVIIGRCDYSEQLGQQVFNKKKSILIPSDQFYKFVDLVARVQEAYQEEDPVAFECQLQSSKLYKLMGNFSFYRKKDEAEGRWVFSLAYFWKWVEDKKYLQLI